MPSAEPPIAQAPLPRRTCPAAAPPRQLLGVQPEAQGLWAAARHELERAVRRVVRPHGRADGPLVEAEEVGVCATKGAAQRQAGRLCVKGRERRGGQQGRVRRVGQDRSFHRGSPMSARWAGVQA